MADNGPPRSADLMVTMITNSPTYREKLKSEPDEVLREVAKMATVRLPTPAFVTDKVTWRIVVGSLGSVAVAAMLGAIYLSTLDGAPIPDVLTALGAAAIGALAGLLAPSPGRAT